MIVTELAHNGDLRTYLLSTLSPELVLYICLLHAQMQLYMYPCTVVESYLSQTQQLCWLSSVCRWPGVWSISAVRPLSTETWLPGTSSSLKTRLARSVNPGPCAMLHAILFTV